MHASNKPGPKPHMAKALLLEQWPQVCSYAERTGKSQPDWKDARQYVTETARQHRNFELQSELKGNPPTDRQWRDWTTQARKRQKERRDRPGWAEWSLDSHLSVHPSDPLTGLLLQLSVVAQSAAFGTLRKTEAAWAVRLGSTLDGLNLLARLYVIREYAERELLAQPGQPAVTADLDLLITFQPWTSGEATAAYRGFLRAAPYFYPVFNRQLFWNTEGVDSSGSFGDFMRAAEQNAPRRRGWLLKELGIPIDALDQSGELQFTAYLEREDLAQADPRTWIEIAAEGFTSSLTFGPAVTNLARDAWREETDGGTDDD